ncbi:BHLH domain-containing protein [Fusarium keratoplasticum]|nr:BHLH domain-containing protein [Fusarium keratoplasticum]
MDATICPFDMFLSCRTSKKAAASKIGPFLPAWDQSIPRSDNSSKKAPFYENYYEKDPPGLCFNNFALSSFQSTAVSSPESDCISSPILDVEMAVNFCMSHQSYLQTRSRD